MWKTQSEGSVGLVLKVEFEKHNMETEECFERCAMGFLREDSILTSI